MTATHIMNAFDALWLLAAVIAEQEKFMATLIRTIVEILGRSLAVVALSNDFSLIAEIDGHTIIECVQGSFPV